jgi:signal transduction histidine kinase/DNA-binding response OmpR family regulator
VIPIATPDQTTRDEYRAALRKYVGDGGEDSLLVGYSIGRETIAEGLTSLVALHGEALKEALGSDVSPARLPEMIDRSTQFLEEALAPFEMTVRGFQESNDHLVHANEELKRAEEMEKRFLANMSHELRTPLNAILGFAELLIDDRGVAIGPERRLTFLQTIHNSGKHLLDLINDILDMAKVDAGQMSIDVERVRVKAAIADAIGVVEPLARDRGIALEAKVGSLAAIKADPGRLKQVLLNLLSNAIKFTDDGGRVDVSARRQGRSVRFEVTDTGIGITPEDQNRLFHDFQQVSAGPARRQQGTGLGLALSKRLVELHGGQIGVISAPNSGSTFWFTMPAATTEEPSPPPVRHETEQGSGPLVLVVEDDPKAAELLIHYLLSAGYRAEVAIDGVEALEKARKLRPAAITLDVLLPKLDGWNVLAELKLDPSTHDIPVVMVSVVNQRSHGRALGAADYFVKPVNRDALIARLNHYAFTTKVKVREVKILIVDDDPTARELLAKILQPIGFTVFQAGSGEDGIELARHQAPDLVILDLVMPGMSGFEVVKVLKADHYTRAIPVLVVTAKDMTAEEKTALNGDVEAVLSKGSLASIDLSTWLEEALGPHAAPGPLRQ